MGGSRQICTSTKLALLAVCLCTSGCYVRIDNLGRSTSLPKLSPAEQIQSLESLRRKVEQERASLNAIPRGRICALVSKPTDSIDEAALTAELKRSLVEPLIANLSRSVAIDAYGDPTIQPTFKLRPLKPADAVLARETRFQAEADDKPNALGVPMTTTSGAITVSSDLLARLCEATDAQQGFDELIESVDRKMAAIRSTPAGSNETEEALFDVLSMSMDLPMAQIQADVASFEFLKAMIFILGHEMAHVMFDARSLNTVSPVQQETRADVFGAVVAEGLTGSTSALEDARRGGERRGHWSTNKPLTVIRVSSEEGFRTTLETVYVKAGLTEGNREHPPIPARIKAIEDFMGSLNDQK